MKQRLILLILLLVLGFPAAPAAQRSIAPLPKSKLFDTQKLISDLEVLASDEMEGRSADRPAMQKVREYVERRFRESGLTPVKQEFDIRRRGTEAPLKGMNFIGTITGQKHPDKFIVITAHYDHEGIVNGQIYNGADDNASGTAALFAIASYFKKHRPEHSLLIVAFDAEEKGLSGSRYFVSNPPVPKGSMRLNVNLDMISRSDKNELYVAGTYHYPQLKPALEAVQKKSRIKLLLGHDDPKLGRDDWTGQSDHTAFHREKIPFIYFGVEDHKDYHRPTDDFANIQPEFYVRAVETIIEAVKALDKRTSE